jgi:hypothetical protein
VALLDDPTLGVNDWLLVFVAHLRNNEREIPEIVSAVAVNVVDWGRWLIGGGRDIPLIPFQT